MDAASGGKRTGAAALLLAAVAVLVAWAFFAGGASGTDATAPLGTAAVLVAAALVVGWSRRRIMLPRLDRAGLVAAGAAVGLVAWTGLSIWWSIAGDRSWDALANGIVLLAFGIVGLAAGLFPGRPLRSLALLLAVALGVVLVSALLGKAIPALGPDDVGSAARLKGSIGYWNALALLADAALAIGLWLLVSVPERFGRPAGALLFYTATIVVLMTQSRAGAIAAVVVVAMALWLSDRGVEAALLGLLAGGPAVVVVAWAFTRPVVVEDGVGDSGAEVALATGDGAHGGEQVGGERIL